MIWRLLIGSYYIRKEGKADRAGVLRDLYAAEVLFNVEKRRLVEMYFDMYEHTADALEQHDLAQRITDVIVTRTRLDLEANNFNTAFSANVATQASRCALLRSLFRHQIRQKRTVCTDECSQTAEFTSAGSLGTTCTLDQKCLIELGTPWRVLTLEPFNKAQRQWIARRGLGSAASHFPLRVDGHQSDFFPSTFPSTARQSAWCL